MKPAASRWGAGARTPPAVGSPAQRRDASGSSRARRRPWCRADSARAFKTSEARTRTNTTSEEAGEDEQRWDLWLALPLQPGKRRVTRRRELVKNKIYSFEQLLGTLDVIVNQRMTVVALRGGGLFVHSPVAPTKECLRLLEELELKHGSVRYIVLPTTAVEHKVFFGPFCREFPEAELFAAPRQWSIPPLPNSFLGFPRKVTTISTEKRGEYPWQREFDIAILNLTVGIGPFVEVAFYHKSTRTLLVTDTCFMIPEEPPEVCQVDPTPLLKRARDDKRDGMVMSKDTEANRIKGWWKTILFSIFFQPSSVEFAPWEWPTALVWRDDRWVEKVKTVQNKLLVAPILQELVFSRDPNGALEYMRKLCKFRFRRIVPAHFDAPIEATPRDLRRAAAFLKDGEDGDGDYPESELKLLRGLTQFLTITGIAGKPKV